MNINLKHKTDEELIKLFCKTENKRAFSLLFNRYHQLVYISCFKYMKQEDMAKEMASQIFEKLLLSICTYEIKSFRSWLYRLVVNHCLQYLRKNKIEISKEDFASFSLEEESTETPNTDIETLNQALSSLKPEQQKCIELFYYEKLSYLQVADLTGYELKKVKSYIQNGKRKMKIFIEQNGGIKR